MSKISRPPIGLQSVLGNVNQGQNPDVLNREVHGQVDMLPFLLTQTLESKFESTNIVKVLGQGINLVVPDGEHWIVVAAAAKSFLAAAEYGRISLSIVNPAGGIFTQLAIQQAPATALAQIISTGLLFPERFMLPSSWSLRAEWEDVSGGVASSMICSAHYYRIPT